MKTSTIALVLAFILAVGVSFYLGGQFMLHHYESPYERPDTVTIEKWHHDTIPAPMDGTSVVVKTVYLPVHDTVPYAVHDTLHKVDSVLVEVPITERKYLADDYQATVRGFQPELVDIWIKQRETTITVPYRKRWGFSAGAQFGYGITPKGWQPYAGVGATVGYSF